MPLKREHPDRKTVLFLAKYLDAGGVTTHMMTLALGLKQGGWDVHIASGGITGQHCMTPTWFEAAGVKHHDVRFDLATKSPLRVLYVLFQMLILVATCKPDIVHVHWRVTSVFAQTIKILFGIPFVSTLHLDNIPFNPLAKLFSFWGNVAVAVSTETYRTLNEKFRVSHDRIRIIYNGVDASYFRPPQSQERKDARCLFGVQPDEYVVCIIGRLDPVKRHDLLLQAVARMRSRPIVVVAGTGDLQQTLQDVCLKLGVESKIRFVGFVNSRDVLWASDVFVLPSRQEGFPVSVVESMMCAVPVIRTPAGGAQDQIIDGENGILIPFEDVQAIKEALELLTDCSVRMRYAHNAFAAARAKFDAISMTRAVEAVYASVLRKENENAFT